MKTSFSRLALGIVLAMTSLSTVAHAYEIEGWGDARLNREHNAYIGNNPYNSALGEAVAALNTSVRRHGVEPCFMRLVGTPYLPTYLYNDSYGSRQASFIHGVAGAECGAYTVTGYGLHLDSIFIAFIGY